MKLPVLLSTAFLLALATPACSPSIAATVDDRQACQLANSGVLPADQMIAACDAIISGGQATKSQLSLAHAVLGEQYCLKRDYTNAVVEHTQAINLDPHNPVPYRDRAVCFGHMGSLHWQLADLNRAIALAPDFSKALADRGSVYEGLDKEELALADFNQALSVDPDNAELINDRAWAYFRLGRYADAANAFDSVARLYRDGPPPILVLWAHVARLRAHIPDDEAFQVASSRFPTSGWPRRVLELYLGRMSIEDFKRPIRVTLLSPEESCRLKVYGGEYALIKGDTAEAKSMLEAAVDVCSDSPEAATTARRDAESVDPAYAAEQHRILQLILAASQ